MKLRLNQTAQLLFILLWAFCLPASAEDCCHSPEDRAPIGVMGAHTHSAGEWMVGYRYMLMKMDSGGHSEPHAVAPHAPSTMPHGHLHHTAMEHDATEHHGASIPSHRHKMLMQMHMPEIMYAPNDTTTLMLMIPIHQLTMDHHNSTNLTTRSDGLGDVSLTGLVRFWNNEKENAHINLGLSFPTGSITKTAEYHDGESRHPYGMKLGSGTFDLLPGITYTGESNLWHWGAQAGTTLRLGENKEGYTFGDRYSLTAWGAYKICRWFSASLRLAGNIWEDIKGNDPEIRIAGAMGNASQQAGRELVAHAGFNLYAPYGPLKGHRLGVEFGLPVAETLNDGVHGTDWLMTAGWLFSF